MKKIFLFTLAFFFCLTNILFSQSETDKEKPKSDASESKSIVDSLQGFVERFDKFKTEASNIKSDTNLSRYTKNENIKKIWLSASATLDSLESRFKNLKKSDYPNYFESVAQIVDEDKAFLGKNRNYLSKNGPFNIIKESTKILSILGDAGVITSASKEGSLPSKFSIGMQYQMKIKKNDVLRNTFFAKALFVIFSNPDTITAAFNPDSTVNNQGQFGATILNPSAGASAIQSGYYESKHYLGNNFLVKNSLAGITLNIGFSSRIWVDSLYQHSESANVFSFNIGGFLDILDPEFDKIGLNAHLLYITRTLMGDVTNNVNFRENVLSGATKEFFNGFELGLKLEWKTFSAFVRMPIIINASNIQGLSGGQFIGGVNFTVPVEVLAF